VHQIGFSLRYYIEMQGQQNFKKYIVIYIPHSYCYFCLPYVHFNMKK